MRRLFAFVGIVAVVLFARFCIVILDEREQAFRTLLNQPEPRLMGYSLNRPLLTEPGLYLRIPGLHQIHRFDVCVVGQEERWLFVAEIAYGDLT